MRKIYICSAFFFSLLGSPASAQEQSDYERLHRESDGLRREMVAEKLPLSDAEAEAFWSLYLEYRVAGKELDDQRVDLIRRLEESTDDLTDKDGKNLVMEALVIEEKRQSFKQNYLMKFSLVLPGSKLLRYYQIETKLDALKRYYWTSYVQFVPIAE